MTAGDPSPWRALRHRNFRLYFAGQCVSLLGTWIQQVALSWLVYRLTGSTLLLGTVAFLTQAPQLIVGPFAGIWIDRADRRRLMLLIQSLMLAQATALAALSYGGWIAPWHVLLAALALGLLNSVDAPLRHAMVGQLVTERADLSNAIALNTFSFNAARFVGPPLAGVLVGLTSEAACFAMNGLSFVAVIAALLRIRTAPGARATGPLGAALGEGLRYARDTYTVRALLLQVAILNLLAAPYVALMPAFARDVFRGGPDTLGLLLGAAGLGALCAALYLAARRSVRGLTGIIAGGNLLAALALIGFSLADMLWLGIALLFLLGFGMIVCNASTNTILQTILPEHLRGRVLALFTSCVLGMAALGGLLAGSIAEHVGAWPTLLSMAVLLLLGALRFRSRLGRLQQYTRILYAELGISRRDPPAGR